MPNLQDLGLSKYESQAYLALLKIGPTTAKEVSRVSGVPMGRVYEVLDQLEELSVVSSEEETRPKRYVAVQPRAAVDRLLDARLKELHKQITEYEQIATDLPAQINSQLSDDPVAWSAAVGADEADELLLDRIESATESISVLYGGVALDPDFEDNVPKATTKLDDALSRGVSIQVMVEQGVMESLFADDDEDVLKNLYEYSNWNVRESDMIDISMYMFDDSELCLVVPSPLTPSEALAVINIKGKQLSVDFTQAFESLWTEASPVVPPDS